MRICLLIPLLCLAACAQPTTTAPMVTDSEIRAEREAQARMAQGSVSIDYAEASYSKSAKLKMKKRLEKITHKMQGEATTLCYDVMGEDADCRFNVVIRSTGNQRGLNASADGNRIFMNAAMIDFLEDDDDLAVILAHEYAHHMMDHIGALNQNAATGAVLGEMFEHMMYGGYYAARNNDITNASIESAVLAFSPEFEREADYVAMYILARAGMNYDAAPILWRKMAIQSPSGIYSGVSHPSTPERAVMLKKAAEEIDEKIAFDDPLMPNTQLASARRSGAPY